MPTIKKLPRRAKKEERYKPRCYHNEAQRWERAQIYSDERWQKLRRYKLEHDPLDEVELARGHIVGATEVHHIKSFMSVPQGSDRYALAFNYDNLLSVTRHTHWRIHHDGLNVWRNLDGELEIEDNPIQNEEKIDIWAD